MWSSTSGIGLRSLDDSFDGISKFLCRNPNTNFIAEENGQIIGIILCGHDGRRAYIYHTAVNPDFRKRGIGQALVQSVIESLRKEKINKVALVVFKTNSKGDQFWNSLGFQRRYDLIYRNMSLNDTNF